MRCSFCGNELEEGVKYCPLCGTKVKGKVQKDPEKHAEEVSEADDERCGDPNGYPYEYGQQSNPGSYQYGSNRPNDQGDQGAYQYGESGTQDSYQYGSGAAQDQDTNASFRPAGTEPYGQPMNRISGTKYIVFSILTTICCCPPLGIASIIYASKIEALQRSGDYVGAKKAAKTARILMIIGLIVGLATMVVAGTNTVSTLGDMINTSEVYEIEEDELVEEESESDSTAEAVPRTDVQKADGLGDIWSSFTIQVNDKVLQFPCTISEVEETGLKMDDEYWEDDAIVEAGEYELVFFSDDNLHSLMFMAVNNSATDKKVSECPLSGIYVSEFDIRDEVVTVIFPGDVRVGDEISEVEAKWGTATEVTEGDSFDSYAWYSGEANVIYCVVYVDSETGIVTDIDLDGQYLE